MARLARAYENPYFLSRYYHRPEVTLSTGRKLLLKIKMCGRCRLVICINHAEVRQHPFELLIKFRLLQKDEARATRSPSHWYGRNLSLPRPALRPRKGAPGRRYDPALRQNNAANAGTVLPIQPV